MDILLQIKPQKTKIKTCKGTTKFLQCRSNVSVDADTQLLMPICETTVTSNIQVCEMSMSIILISLLNSRV